MKELYKIKKKQSLQHYSQTPEERKQEWQETMDWYARKMGRPIDLVGKPKE
jgi:hypothetical protein